MSPFQKTAILFFATGAGAGYSPWFPGSAGTLIAIPLSLSLNGIAAASLPLAFFILIAFTVCAGWLCQRAEGIFQAKDSPKIVIDEIAGFLLANFLSPFGWAPTGAAFVLFRFFDIIKPFPAGRAEKLPGGVGVILDDLIAGCYTLLILRLLLFRGLL